GHAGTLDPSATGVLVVAVGEATKLVQYLTADSKVYRTRIELGRATDSGDADGVVVAESAVPAGLSPEAVQAVANRFLGAHSQRVPKVSAVKVDGERLHARARRGEAIEAPVREVVLHAVTVLAVIGTTVELELACAKGFYVRSFGEALAEALGTVGHLTMLERTRSGAFTLDGAVSTDRLLAARSGDEAARAEVRAHLMSLADAWAGRPAAVLTEEGARAAFHGRAVAPGAYIPRTEEPLVAGDVLGCFSEAGDLVALAAIEAPGGALRVVRGIRTNSHGAAAQEA
ncbi:MAG: tRNA pseudouridine(55) synthase TruB, partial [Myxococcales bacterium]|nr:tRNA pseudouridine(55) synthase TruB [Myxococcales bacterium]